MCKNVLAREPLSCFTDLYLFNDLFIRELDFIVFFTLDVSSVSHAG